MIITKLEKKKRLYLLELDQTDRLYITEDTIVKFMLSKGKAIDQDLLREIKSFAQLSYGKDLALYHLSFKARTAKEVQDYLKKYEIDENIIPKILDQLKADKWIDDHRYAQHYIQSNQNTGDKGPYILKQKLQQKGIALPTIDQVLDEADFSEIAERVSQKLHRQYGQKLNQRALKDKISQSLINKGFTYTTAKAALDKLQIENDEDLEAELLNKETDKLYRRYSKKYQGYELQQRLTQALARKGFDYDTIKTYLRDYL